MKQPAHTWIAVRAVGLLLDDPDTEEFGKLLAPHVKQAAIGAWMPDLQDAKIGGSKTENHVPWPTA